LYGLHIDIRPDHVHIVRTVGSYVGEEREGCFGAGTCGENVRKNELIEEIKLKLDQARSLATNLDDVQVLVYFIELAILEARDFAEKGETRPPPST